MKPDELVLPTREFKARCLELIDKVQRDGVTITITKHKKPIARLSPPRAALLPPSELYGAMAGMVTIHGDIEAPLGEVWEADR